MRKRKEGYCLVSLRGQQAFHARRDQYATIRHAWLEGVRFVDIVGPYGDRGTISLADVDGVFDMTPESINASIADERADNEEESLGGGIP
jgi:hypothetical protein